MSEHHISICKDSVALREALVKMQLFSVLNIMVLMTH